MDSSIAVFKHAWRDWNLLKRSVLFCNIATIFMKKMFFDFLIYPWWVSVITGNGFMGNVIRDYVLNGLSNYLPLFIYNDISQIIVWRKLNYCLSNLVNINLLIMPDFQFIRREIMLGWISQTIYSDDSFCVAKNELHN